MELLVEDAPATRVAASFEGEACSLENYLTLPDHTMDERIAAARKQLGQTADVPGNGGPQVILPDLNAGCSMADMAEISQVEDCWESLERMGLGEDVVTPLTYMNSTAAIKAFCGERGGLVCTSSNAAAAFDWAFERREKILFLPDH